MTPAPTAPDRHHAGGKRSLPLAPGVCGGAAFHGPCDCYRTVLWREIGIPDPAAPKRYALWIGMNPSVAAGDVDDPTVRREWLYTTQRLGLLAYRKANLADYCATDPRALRAAPVPIRSDRNLLAIIEMARRAAVVVAAWGANADLASEARETAAALHAAGITLRCLGTTKAGHPRHPLYVARVTPLSDWPSNPPGCGDHGVS